jgi:hypothetical protein
VQSLPADTRTRVARCLRGLEVISKGFDVDQANLGADDITLLREVPVSVSSWLVRDELLGGIPQVVAGAAG